MVSTWEGMTLLCFLSRSSLLFSKATATIKMCVTLRHHLIGTIWLRAQTDFTIVSFLWHDSRIQEEANAKSKAKTYQHTSQERNESENPSKSFRKFHKCSVSVFAALIAGVVVHRLSLYWPKYRAVGVVVVVVVAADAMKRKRNFLCVPLKSKRQRGKR